MGHNGGFQPYARGQQRPQTSALQAMLAGKPGGGLPHPPELKAGTSAGTEQRYAPIQSQVLAEFIENHRTE